MENKKGLIMKTSHLTLWIVLVTLVALITPCSAGSIWSKRTNNARALYTDDVARNIGDILTIKIAEDSSINNKAKRDLQKQTDRSTTFDGELDITTNNHNLLPRIPSFNMTAASDNSLSSKADFKDQRSFADQITVVVVDILPNRNLVVTGTRNREIAGDIQIIEVSGIVRPSDISFSNVVESQYVANFRIISRNAGIAEPFNRPGWFGRFLDVVSPF